MEAKCKYSYYKSSGDCAYLYPKRSISVCLWSLLFCIRKPPRSKHFVTTWNMQFFVVHLSLMVQSSVSYCMGTIIFTSSTKSSVWEITFKSTHCFANSVSTLAWCNDNTKSYTTCCTKCWHWIYRVTEIIRWWCRPAVSTYRTAYRSASVGLLDTSGRRFRFSWPEPAQYAWA